MRGKIKIRIRRVRGDRDFPLPSYQTEQAVGLDLCADIDQDVIIPPLARVLIPTGYAISIPIGFEGQVRPRSGLALKHGITVLNSPGTIDPDYRGEVKVVLVNLSNQTFVIKRGDRIAQLVISPAVRAELQEVDSLDDTKRGDRGFGHTG